jgi:hypothetical protein
VAPVVGPVTAAEPAVLTEGLTQRFTAVDPAAEGVR